MADPNKPTSDPGKPAKDSLYQPTRADSAPAAPVPARPANLYGSTLADAAAGTPPDRSGLGAGHQYQILVKIAEGGMGVVALAKDLTLDRHVALKRIAGDYAANERLLQ